MSSDPKPSQDAITLYDRFTHGIIERREFMTRMAAIAGSAAAASTLIACMKADEARAARTDAAGIGTDRWEWNRNGRMLSGYVARPEGEAKPKAAVIVIHENRGLTEHIRDVARRFAKAGYFAMAPDFLSADGGTPADEDAARDMIGKLDLAVSNEDGLSAITDVAVKTELPVFVTGFCWGGAMTLRLAVAAGDSIAGAVPFYGPAPDPSEAAKIEAPVLIHLAGLDERVNTTAVPFAEALKAAGKDVTVEMYEGVNHAFHNDTSAARYDEAAATLAWQRTLDFIAAHHPARAAM